jgi:hypothetical protein
MRGLEDLRSLNNEIKNVNKEIENNLLVMGRLGKCLA